MQKPPPDGDDSASCMVKSQLFSFHYAGAHLGLHIGSERLMLVAPAPSCAASPKPGQTQPRHQCLFAVLVHRAGLLPSANLTCWQTPMDTRICNRISENAHVPRGWRYWLKRTPTITHTAPGPHQADVLSLRYRRAAAPARIPWCGAAEEEPLDLVSLMHSPSFSYYQPVFATGHWAEPIIPLSQRYF